MRRRPDSGIWTYTGRYVYPLYPRVEGIDIADIAHALSNLCRYTGHVSEFYSVAEHSVRVFWSLANGKGIYTWTTFQTMKIATEKPGMPTDALNRMLTELRWALLHDATEAYLNDWSRPLKHHWLFGFLYRRAERRLMRVICDKFRLPHEEPKVIKLHDNKLLLAEQRYLMSAVTLEWGPDTPASPETIIPLAPKEAEEAFLKVYNYLYGGQLERQNTTTKEAVRRLEAPPSAVNLESLGSQQL